jgi:glycosyltransferase involved in cell wall biosynthesis
VKILVLTNLYPPHHAGTYDFRCQTVTEALCSRGHQVRVLTSSHGLKVEQRGEEVERRLQLNGVFDHAPVTRYGELRDLETANHAALREALERFRPDLIHVWSLAGLSKSLIFALRQSRLPTVYDVADDWLAAGIRHDPWLRWWNDPGGNLPRSALELSGQRNRLDVLAPTRLMKGYERLPDVYGAGAAAGNVAPNSIAAFRFDRLYFCSQSLKDETERAGFRVNHAEVIPPGIATQLYIGDIKPAAAPMERFLVVSRLTRASGVLTAVKALRLAHHNRIQASLSIYGKGDSDYIAELRSFVATNQLPVEFLSVSDIHRDLPAVYRGHDALIYTVEWNEPYSLTPLEAMACGLPVIGTTLGGAGELLRPGENAWTYTAGSAEELAARLQELQRQPALRCQMAEHAQQEVQSFHNESAVTDRIENYLNTSLEVWQHTAS